MEAIAALSLACNVTQTVGQALTIARTIREIQQRGGLSDDEHLSDLSGKLSSGAAKVDERLRIANLSTLQGSSLDEIREIARDLLNISAELQKTLDKLQRTDQRLTTAVKQAAKTLAKRHDIQNLEKKLKDHQQLLNSRLIIELWQQLTVTIQNAETSRLIKSLHFPEMNRRINQITSTSESSFRWIFEIEDTSGNLQSKDSQANIDSDAKTARNLGANELTTASELKFRRDAWMGFRSWLRHDSQEIYWINGKAGSGKSTLMKKIWDHAKTTELLKRQSDPRKTCVLRYGFWLSGSPLQRSLGGLISSLLYQLLSAYPLLAQEMLQNAKHLSAKLTFDDWSEGELQHELIKALHSSADVLKVGVFVDGLDEHDPKRNPRDLSKLLDLLAGQAHAKVCVSSRPESLWTARFRQAPQLRLQDLNRSDIETYVSEQLQEIDLPIRRGDGEHSPEDLAKEVASRAQGVFLWAHVVTKLLIRGADNMASRNELWQRLCGMPEEIQALYEDMLIRLGSELNFTAPEMALYLKACLLEPLIILTIAFAANLQSKVRGHDEIQPQWHNIHEFENRCKSIRQRISNVCTGLLDINEPGGYSFIYFGNTKRELDSSGIGNTPFCCVEFSHRCVRDFVIDTDAGKAVLDQCPLSDEAILDTYLQTYIILQQLIEPTLNGRFALHLVQEVLIFGERPVGDRPGSITFANSRGLDLDHDAALTRLLVVARFFLTKRSARPMLSEYRDMIPQNLFSDGLTLLLSCAQDDAFDTGKCPDSLSSPPYDCLGIISGRSMFGRLSDIWNLITLTPEISHQYASYLLLCMTWDWHAFFDHLKSQNWTRLLQAGASLYTNFSFPWLGYGQTCAASALLSSLLIHSNHIVPSGLRRLDFAKEQILRCDAEPYALLAFTISSTSCDVRSLAKFLRLQHLQRAQEPTFWLKVNLKKHLDNILQRFKLDESPLRAFLSAFRSFIGDRIVFMTGEQDGIIPSDGLVESFCTCVTESIDNLYNGGFELSQSPLDRACAELRSRTAEKMNIFDFFRQLGYIKDPSDPEAVNEPIPQFDPMPETQEELDALIGRLSQRHREMRTSEQFQAQLSAVERPRIWFPRKPDGSQDLKEVDDIQAIRRTSTEFFDAAETVI